SRPTRVQGLRQGTENNGGGIRRSSGRPLPPEGGKRPAGMDTDGRKLFVAKMPEDIREDEIRIVFNTYGTVQEVVMLGPERSRPGQRCGFVIYETPE
ncbi:unnamed protein product, partial [Symbiodinium sp. KB8]